MLKGLISRCWCWPRITRGRAKRPLQPGRRIRGGDLSALREQLGVSPAAHENDQAALARVVKRVDQQKVAADVALAMDCPFTRQRVVEPLRRKWPIVGDQQRHGLFQPSPVVPTGMGQAKPVPEEVLGVVRRARQVRSLTCGGLLRGYSEELQRLRSERDGS